MSSFLQRGFGCAGGRSRKSSRFVPRLEALGERIAPAVVATLAPPAEFAQTAQEGTQDASGTTSEAYSYWIWLEPAATGVGTQIPINVKHNA
jgi:hypothetical protein